jgi:hypothetical protein
MHRFPRVALPLLLLLLGPAAAPAAPAPEAALATLERWVRPTFFPTARPAERGARWDIPAEANTRFDGLPVRLAAGRSGGALELGEALRLYPVTEPFLLVAGFWSADGDGARFVSVHAVRVEPERWRALWEPVAFADLKRFDDLCRDPARPIEETRRLALRLRAEDPYRLAAIQLQPRLDDRQRRLDATLRAEEFRRLPGAGAATDGAPMLWGTPWTDPRIR